MPTTAGKLLMYEMEKQLKQTQGLKDLIDRRFLFLVCSGREESSVG